MLDRPPIEKAPDAATSKGQPNTVEANDTAHIAHDGRAGNRIVAFRAATGETWSYSGKRATVLAMLASNEDGVTQWDTLPWHTRLGASIHAMRQDGLEIVTEIEGRYRHARYRLATSGSLIIHPHNSGAVT